ncbi:copper chaperone CopZ [Kribbella orskensis]|uniref:Copper chaperone CopZ n=1 Tax=Kribbella orskensis TaxID=2512216 RepID=A0ABY2BJJ9_9ACTN|nr:MULTISPECIES: heavy-metal-associated domain-containing protein [Kribbella]TCN39352.1 copper chaperone CopZ [Kribbella sp. VKM Ac-2500]TCO21999.1 copper chaperone CopZ [Kribbella orskensis]
MNTQTFRVLGMTCVHCVDFVSAELERLPGITSVEVDLPAGSVTLTSTHHLTATQIRSAVEEAGYDLPAPTD